MPDDSAALQYWNPPGGVFRNKFWQSLFALDQVHLLGWNADALFCEENTYTARVGRRLEVIKLHAEVPFFRFKSQSGNPACMLDLPAIVGQRIAQSDYKNISLSRKG